MSFNVQKLALFYYILNILVDGWMTSVYRFDCK